MFKWIGKIFGYWKRPKIFQNDKTKTAIELIDILLEHYNSPKIENIDIGGQIGTSMAYLHLAKIKAELMVKAYEPSDELIVELEKAIIEVATWMVKY